MHIDFFVKEQIMHRDDIYKYNQWIAMKQWREEKDNVLGHELRCLSVKDHRLFGEWKFKGKSLPMKTKTSHNLAVDLNLPL